MITATPITDRRRDIRVWRVGGVVFGRGMAIEVGGPGVDGLGGVVRVLGEWQYDGAPVQLHPGGAGWFWRFGATRFGGSVRAP
jgi:hypothetical protein